MRRFLSIASLCTLAILLSFAPSGQGQGRDSHRSDEISPPREIIFLYLHYDRGDITLQEAELRRGYLPGYKLQPSTGYRAELIDNEDQRLFAVTFEPPLLIMSPPPLPGDRGEEAFLTLQETDFALILPYSRLASRVDIVDPRGITHLSIGVHEMKDRTERWPPIAPRPVKAGLVPGAFKILFIGDDYTTADLPLFQSDVLAHSALLLSVEPFATYAAEMETLRLDNTQDLGCYHHPVMTRLILCDHTKVLAVASASPYDEIIVLVNDDEYGGSGLITIGGGGSTTYAVAYHDVNAWGRQVTVHEFGHSFGGLMDEYESGIPTGPSIAPNCSDDPTSWSDITPEFYLGCSYGNLYRSTYSDCLMRTLVPDTGFHYCLVCQRKRLEPLLDALLGLDHRVFLPLIMNNY